MTMVFGLLFSAVFRIDKKKNYGQSIEQFAVAQSTARNDDQIIHQNNEELDLGPHVHINIQQEGYKISYERQLYDGLIFYEPSLLHPLVHKFCCCPQVNAYKEEEHIMAGELRYIVIVLTNRAI